MEANSEHMIIALEERRDLVVPTVFTLTIFTSASLLFFVQPMFAKMVLPFLGGSSAVWTTAMLFFQSTLILGYLYAHLSVKYLPQRVQVFVHMLVWALALVFLPIAIPHDWSYDPSRSAALQTLMLFAVGVGMPFAALSATAPLLQAWYARSDGRLLTIPTSSMARAILGHCCHYWHFHLWQNHHLALGQSDRAGRSSIASWDWDYSLPV